MSKDVYAKSILSEKGKRKFCDQENYVYEKHQDNKKNPKNLLALRESL